MKSLAVTPHAHLVLVDVATGGDDVAPPIGAAIARGRAHAVLHLATSALQATVAPPLAFFRELGKSLLRAACAAPSDFDDGRALEPPLDELAQHAAAVPPMTGAEYVDAALLADVWRETDALLRVEAKAAGGLAAYLKERAPLWSVVGRVCFHLAENKRDPEAPFAFVATYADRLSSHARVQHVPLGQALREYGGAKNQAKLLALLEPVSRATDQSAFLRALVEEGDVYHPLAWTPAEAHAFLKDVPIFESCGLVVRLPDWWSTRAPPRPQVTVTIGGKKPSGLGMDALLEFSAAMTLDGEPLGDDEIRALLAANEGLVLLKGRWVEVDRDKLGAVLAHWKKAQREAARGTMTMAEALRLLAGANVDARDGEGPTSDAAAKTTDEWSKVIAGGWLAEVMGKLRDPSRAQQLTRGLELRAELRPYQDVGARWLWLLGSLGLGACLADDMGLGKTIQVIALLLARRRDGAKRPNLLVVPASLVANWKSELDRFAPTLGVFIAHGSAQANDQWMKTALSGRDETDLVITTYGTLARVSWLAQTRFGLVVLDEAQAIKNPGARQTRATKALVADARIALTGTPVEIRLGDLWSIFDFLNPGLLGSAKAFGRLTKRMEDKPGEGYAPLRKLVQPYLLRRLKSDRSIVADLPDKTEVVAWCNLSPTQAALYQQSVDALAARLREVEGIERRGAVLAFLMRFKQICDHPSLWLGDGAFSPEASGKLARLRELCEPIAARQAKVLVFTQFQSMTAPLAAFLAPIFGRTGAILDGTTPVKQRKTRVDDFQRDEGAPFFVLSLKAGGTGLNLTAASHVIHFDRWWNPAVEDQATDRAYRIGQRKNVLVHKFVCRGTVEEKIDALITSKRATAGAILAEGGGEALLTEMSDDELLRIVSLDARRALAEDSSDD